MFKTLSQNNIYKHNGKEVVFVSFDHEQVKVRVRDMSGNYYEVNVWELEEREEAPCSSR